MLHTSTHRALHAYGTLTHSLSPCAARIRHPYGNSTCRVLSRKAATAATQTRLQSGKYASRQRSYMQGCSLSHPALAQCSLLALILIILLTFLALRLTIILALSIALRTHTLACTLVWAPAQGRGEWCCRDRRGHRSRLPFRRLVDSFRGGARLHRPGVSGLRRGVRLLRVAAAPSYGALVFLRHRALSYETGVCSIS